MITEKRNALRSIFESSGGVHLSAYIANRSPSDDLRTQVADILKKATESIRPAMPRAERTRFLKPIQALMDDPRILQTIKGNIGIFRTQDSFRILHVPVEVETTSFVATTFHVKPLIRWLQTDRDFILVGIEKGALHVYQGSQHSLRHVDTLILSREVLNEVSFGARLGIWGAKGFAKQRVADVNEWLEERLELLSKTSSPKLFFAGNRHFVNALKFDLSYRNIAKDPNWFSFKTKQLSNVCAEIRNVLTQDAERHLSLSFLEFRYANNLDLTESNVFQIARASIEGRVKRLMIASEINLFGKLNRRTGDLALHKADLDHEDDCVLDDLAQTVLAHGGSVIVAPKSEMPGGHSVLAITNPPDPSVTSNKTVALKFRNIFRSESVPA